MYRNEQIQKCKLDQCKEISLCTLQIYSDRYQHEDQLILHHEAWINRAGKEMRYTHNTGTIKSTLSQPANYLLSPKTEENLKYEVKEPADTTV